MKCNVANTISSNEVMSLHLRGFSISKRKIQKFRNSFRVCPAVLLACCPQGHLSVLPLHNITDWPTKQDRNGQGKTGQDRSRQDRTKQDRTGQDRTDGSRRVFVEPLYFALNREKENKCIFFANQNISKNTLKMSNQLVSDTCCTKIPFTVYWSIHFLVGCSSKSEGLFQYERNKFNRKCWIS